VPESRRDEQKLWLILFQIRSVRSRLNSLATQQWLFTTLALIIGGAALIVIAAAKLGPFGFLGVSTVVLLVAASGIFAAARRGWAARVDVASAAGLADRRAELKGRLTTVLALSESAKQAQLWPFLVEDTYAMRDDFEPRRIEPRLVSRSLGALLAALLLAVLALPDLNRGGAAARQIASGGAAAGGQITADLSQLQIQPADPALQPNAQIYADPETLRRLQQKLAAEGSSHQRKGLGGLMDKARQFADAFQHQLAGRNPEASAPLNLRLADRNPDHTPDGHNGSDQSRQMAKNSANTSAHRGAAGAAANGRHANRSGTPPPTAIPGSQADQMAKNSAGATSQPNQSSNSNQAGANNDANPPEQDAANDFGGANHGIGADPEHLFGPPSAQPFGSDSFKIAIDAEPSDEASAPGSPAYLPPKVRVPLNPNQLPDEPIARAAVPANEQTIIKRVFDR
jgi:hypothetical protein